MLPAMDAMSLLGGMLGSGFGKGRGPGIGTIAAGAAGLAAAGGLGYMAYRHFQGQKAPGQQPPGGPGWGAPAGAAPPAPGGGIGGMLSGIVGSTGGLRTDGFSVPGYEWQTQGAQPAAPQPVVPPPYPPGAQPPPPAPATAQQNEDALLLVRAMIAAAYADGAIDDAERTDILARLDAAGVAPAERELFLRELASPKPITAIAGSVRSPELAEQVYVVSLLAIRVDNDAERAYVKMLPGLLNLSAERVAALHQSAGLPAIA
jgi:uncharacterized membrane protein YebE (DUF533 family)